MKTLRQALNEIGVRHSQYIESTYHIRNTRLIRERKELLKTTDAEGGTASEPWLEATPSYETGDSFAKLRLPYGTSEFLTELAQEGLGVFDPPYKHQASALSAFLKDNKDLVVGTGTGSGKTEIFLYSILGQLLAEGKRGKTTGARAVRAIVLYPMNALVSDQLSRLRKFLGSPKISNKLHAGFGRTVQFGMYTSRTPYHGRFDADKNERYVKPAIKYYKELQANPKKVELLRELQSRGRIPAKDIVPFFGERQPPLTRYQTQPGDRELFTRQEMYQPNQFGGTPDVLVTNYSMLQYMLLRPIEQKMFDDTQAWLKSDPKNQIVIVVDEAHLYRGAQGAEISMLLRRLLQHLGINRGQARFILTSASLGSPQAGAKFASDLTASSPTQFSVIEGVRRKRGGVPPLPPPLAGAVQEVSAEVGSGSIKPLARYYGWPDPPGKPEELQAYLARNWGNTAEFGILHDWLAKGPQPLSRLARDLFPTTPREQGENAVLNLALLSTFARFQEDQPLLPMRVHALYRGLPRQYACINPKCPGRRVAGDGPLGKLFISPQLRCDRCSSRVFELYTHRTCGAAFLKVFVHPEELGGTHRFLWSDVEGLGLREVHLMVDDARHDPDILQKDGLSLAQRLLVSYVDRVSGYLLTERPQPYDEQRFVEVRWPPSTEKASVGTRGKTAPPIDVREPLTWVRCGACGIVDRGRAGPKVMDLETKGEEPFANLVRTLFAIQPPAKTVSPELAKKLPNKGRKVLCFSDSRQKAARLARDLQRSVERDSFREMLVLAASEAGPDSPISNLFPQLVMTASNHNICFFDDEDEAEGRTSSGSRTMFSQAQTLLPKIRDAYGLTTDRELLQEKGARMELISCRPPQYDEYLLRSFGDTYYSVRATMVGYVQPGPEQWKFLKATNASIPESLLRSAILATIDKALEKRALDAQISDVSRRMSRSSPFMPRGWVEDPEGLEPDALIPGPVRDRLTDAGLSDQDLKTFENSLKRSGPSGEAILVPSGAMRWWLNPAGLVLTIDANDEWRMCQGCSRIAPYDFDGRCANDKCNGVSIPVPANQLYVDTRKDFLRRPALDLVGKMREPFTLRSEEHTAQLSSKDHSENFGRAEKYELLFQDVLVEELETQQPVDVLSCTTTMEVGIDIGSLTAVALRTVPPRPDNYQQRAGRAGRRASGLSLILTFADNSPHETFIFRNPDQIIGAPNATPQLYVENLKIAERHLHAVLIQLFFQRKGRQATPSNVFESLGASREFFTLDGDFSFKAFQNWIENVVLVRGGKVMGDLVAFLPDDIVGADVSKKATWVSQVTRRFSSQLAGLGLKGGSWMDPSLEDENLLVTLMDDALLPTFGFPIDLCTFAVRDYGRSQGQVINKYEIQQDLAAALNEYVPGKEIVVDKRTYVSYGLYFPFTSDPVNRARVVNWDQLQWLNYCRTCDVIFENIKESLQEKQTPCPSCKSMVESIHRYKPQGFSPKFGREGVVEGGDAIRERMPATRACFPTPITAMPKPGAPIVKISAVSEFQRLSDQRLIVANYGIDRKGFEICQDCGAVEPDPERSIVKGHSRPYPIPLRKGMGFTKTCSGLGVRSSFAFEFTTDLAILRVALGPGIRYAPGDKAFDAAARSLTEAFVLGATRSLGIESSELAGNYRTVARYAGDPDIINGYLEFFLYDTTPGGAGFASQVAQNSTSVLEATKKVLNACTCGASCVMCLRTYDNRFFHPQLNRFYAGYLLEYVMSGRVPDLPNAHKKHLEAVLQSALELRVPGVSLDTSSGTLVARLGTKQARLELGSALKGLAAKPLVQGAPLLALTDYRVEHELPHAIADARRLLRP